MTFKLPFWLLTGSCVITYMSVFPYIQIASDLIQKKYNIDSTTAGKMFGVPYIISAILSPFLGILIDRIGRRALLVTFSSVILIITFLISMNLPGKQGSMLELLPLCMVGVGYSIYCAAIWGSIPYTVQPQTVGTAFGITTAIQNIGLAIAPTIVGLIKDHTHRDHGYFWVNAFFILINIIGLSLNGWLYVVDLKYYDGVLNKVDQGDQIADLMTTPTQDQRKQLIRESMSKAQQR